MLPVSACIPLNISKLIPLWNQCLFYNLWCTAFLYPHIQVKESNLINPFFVDRIKFLLSIGYADLLIALKSGFIFIAILSSVMCLLRFVPFLVSSIMWSDIWGALKIKFWQGIIQYNTPIYIIHCIGGIHKGIWKEHFRCKI